MQGSGGEEGKEALQDYIAINAIDRNEELPVLVRKLKSSKLEVPDMGHCNWRASDILNLLIDWNNKDPSDINTLITFSIESVAQLDLQPVVKASYVKY